MIYEVIITAYCACALCCGHNAQGLTASGHKVREGYVACNWLPFHTHTTLKSKTGKKMGEFEVMDRGAVRLFGSVKHPKYRVDVYMKSHREALRFGKQRGYIQI